MENNQNHGNRTIIASADGSHTLYVPELDEHYHSVHGAVQESMHVFIEAGLKAVAKQELVVFEIGFGTGLNAWLTLNYAVENRQKIQYFSIEKYPLNSDEFKQLNYETVLAVDKSLKFNDLHTSDWEKGVEICQSFTLTKFHADFTAFELNQLPKLDLIYFDAFAPSKQPELWHQHLFSKIVEHCNAGAILVTYCAKGDVRRSLIAAGFRVERIAGPPGKREMLRAWVD